MSVGNVACLVARNVSGLIARNITRLFACKVAGNVSSKAVDLPVQI
jgi:hypothetical protein